MTDFLANIGTILTGVHTGEVGTQYDGILDWFGDVTASLLANDVFRIVAAVVFTMLFIGTIVGLVKGIRGKKKGR